MTVGGVRSDVNGRSFHHDRADAIVVDSRYEPALLTPQPAMTLEAVSGGDTTTIAAGPGVDVRLVIYADATGTTDSCLSAPPRTGILLPCRSR